MFYAKASIGEGVAVEVGIGNDNVFYRCAACNREVPVNLTALLSTGDGDIDLCSFEAYCKKCAKKIRRHIGK